MILYNTMTPDEEDAFNKHLGEQSKPDQLQAVVCGVSVPVQENGGRPAVLLSHLPRHDFFDSPYD